MNENDFRRLCARVAAQGLDAVGADLGNVEDLTPAEAGDLMEIECWRVSPFLGDYVEWLKGRVRDRRQAATCQRAGRCGSGFGRPPCGTCKPFFGQLPHSPPEAENRMDSGDWGAPAVLQSGEPGGMTSRRGRWRRVWRRPRGA
jgi:hypothetical protein